MIRWNNDYNISAHPLILSALSRYGSDSYGGYGLDEWCENASRLIRDIIKCEDAQIHFLIGGTQVNYTVAASILRPYQGIISAHTGHIHAHETGAIEHTGHKIHVLPGENGKLSAAQIRDEARAYTTSQVKEHITEPKMVFLSLPTELGTLYSKKELQEIRQVCDEYHLYLYIDGARLAYGLGSPDCDLDISDLPSLADAFYIGGTKCGALFGEALVLVNDDFKVNFRSHIKQNGGMLAKGWLLGLQFYTLLKDGTYFQTGKSADSMALEIKAAFLSKNIPLYIDSPTNQQFVVLTNENMARLGKNHIFEYQMQLSEDTHCVRFCTSWATAPEDVRRLIDDIMSF